MEKTNRKEERKEKVDLKITLLNIIKYYFVILLFHQYKQI